jgi:hypothetical protein
VLRRMGDIGEGGGVSGIALPFGFYFVNAICLFMSVLNVNLQLVKNPCFYIYYKFLFFFFFFFFYMFTLEGKMI